MIDSVLDIDYAVGCFNSDSANRPIAAIQTQNLLLEWFIEPPEHAIHLSAAPYIPEKRGWGIDEGERITETQEVVGKVFNEGTEFLRDEVTILTLTTPKIINARPEAMIARLTAVWDEIADDRSAMAVFLRSAGNSFALATTSRKKQHNVGLMTAGWCLSKTRL